MRCRALRSLKVWDAADGSERERERIGRQRRRIGRRERERGRERGSVRATARTRPKSKEVMRREEVKLQQDQDKVGRTTARMMMEGSEPSAAGGSLWMPKRERAVAGGGVCFV